MLLCKNEKMDGTLLILDKGLEKKNRAQHKYLQQRRTHDLRCFKSKYNIFYYLWSLFDVSGAAQTKMLLFSNINVFANNAELRQIQSSV